MQFICRPDWGAEDDDEMHSTLLQMSRDDSQNHFLFGNLFKFRVVLRERERTFRVSSKRHYDVPVNPWARTSRLGMVDQTK
mmetsp:Transcript_17954/g.20758  ORF Transcript_17954/g.20758 Transcript_17954/m.20758 type:complete len:81 (-) Transcript_17954:1587-1829(-)